MKTSRFVVVALVLLFAVLAAVFFWPRGQAPEPLPPPPVAAPAPQPVPTPPAVHYPVPEAPPAPVAEAEPPVPDLADSDSYLQQLWPRLFDNAKLTALFIDQDFIRRLVLTVDNLTARTLPRQRLPLQPPGGHFRVTQTPRGPVIGTGNARRYAAYVALAEAVPTARLVDVYRRLYPLLQQAYREMGYPDGHFNDRLVAVLDHLLAAPEPEGPVLLEAHIRRYRYADPTLEALSAGQKILVRMGLKNERRVKSRLRALREALTHLEPAPR